MLNHFHRLLCRKAEVEWRNDQTLTMIIMKKNKKDRTEIESDATKSSKKASGSESPGSFAKRNEKNESNETGTYSFQKDESIDKNKLAPREEL